MRVSTFLIFVTILSVCVTGISYVFFSVSATHVQRIPLEVTVSEISGFNLDKDMLHIGSLQPAGAGFRIVTITNHDTTRRFRTEVKGEIAPWITIGPSSGIIQEHESLNLTVSALIPEHAPYGSVKGELIIFFEP